MTSRKKWSLAGLVVGILLLPAPLFGLFGTIFEMSQAFDDVAASTSPDPADLAEGIYLATAWTVAGLAIFVAGLLLLIASVVSFVTAPREERGASAQLAREQDERRR